MPVLLLILAIQAATVRGDRFQIAVPQGWKTVEDGGTVLIEHASGASVLVLRSTLPRNLQDYAQKQAERIMAPLGFATIGEPRYFKDKDTHDEWVEYEIRGNRLADHRRILYKALHRSSGLFEIVYESGEDNFEGLLTDAQSIASSVQALIEAPPRTPARRAGRR
jgi:hypothetical protein